MTKRQITNKIEDLKFWLISNPNHPNYGTVLKDKRALEKRIIQEPKEYE